MCIIVQTQAWQCSTSKYWKTSRFQNIHKVGDMIKTICTDSKHKNSRQDHAFGVASITCTGLGRNLSLNLHNLTKHEFSLRMRAWNVMSARILNSGWHRRQQSQRPPPLWHSPHVKPASWSKLLKKKSYSFEKKKSHLVSELDSIEFAGVFKQLRPDRCHEKGVW